ncbi:unnamed protein product [Ascophyllum nodosum]
MRYETERLGRRFQLGGVGSGWWIPSRGRIERGVHNNVRMLRSYFGGGGYWVAVKSNGALQGILRHTSVRMGDGSLEK